MKQDNINNENENNKYNNNDKHNNVNENNIYACTNNNKLSECIVQDIRITLITVRMIHIPLRTILIPQSISNTTLSAP